MDYRKCYDKDYLYHYDLEGRNVTVAIRKATAGKVTGTGGKSSKKPVIYFEGHDKGLALCVTNGKTIAAMYGNDMDAWIGKRITLFPTTTEFGGKTVECIRIRPQVPPQPGARHGSRPQDRSSAVHEPETDGPLTGTLPIGSDGAETPNPIDANR